MEWMMNVSQAEEVVSSPSVNEVQEMYCMGKKQDRPGRENNM